MVDGQKIWVDSARCTGCGVCVEVCPVGAIALENGKARLDEAACTGCGACVDVCPEGAIQPVIQGELVPAGEPPAPAVYRPGRLTQATGAAVAVASAGLLARAAGALVRAVGQWLARRPPARQPAAGRAQDVSRSEAPLAGAGGRQGAGRRSRRRRRGG